MLSQQWFYDIFNYCGCCWLLQVSLSVTQSTYFLDIFFALSLGFLYVLLLYLLFLRSKQDCYFLKLVSYQHNTSGQLFVAARFCIIIRCWIVHTLLARLNAMYLCHVRCWTSSLLSSVVGKTSARRRHRLVIIVYPFLIAGGLESWLVFIMLSHV